MEVVPIGYPFSTSESLNSSLKTSFFTVPFSNLSCNSLYSFINFLAPFIVLKLSNLSKTIPLLELIPLLPMMK